MTFKVADMRFRTYIRHYYRPSEDKSNIIKPIRTVTVSAVNTLSFGTINYVQGKMYSVTVKFRTRGDGDSTSSKCSSVGFIAYRSDWTNSWSYIHGPAAAYAERGKIVEWTYTFTATATEARATGLYFIINNGWANGYDNQTIDLYYYRMWDGDGYVYAEDGNANQNIVTKWSDGTAISGEKSVTNTTANENYLWSETIKPSFMTDDAVYTIDYDAKRSGDSFTHELFFYSSDYQTTGYMTSRSMGTPLTEYRHYSHTFTFRRKNASSTLPALRIRFDNNGPGANKSGTLYVRNVKLRLGRMEKPMFLFAGAEYARLYDDDGPHLGQNVRIVGEGYVLKQELTPHYNNYGKRYRDLTSKTYAMLNCWIY